jgi:hypothetical protein
MFLSAALLDLSVLSIGPGPDVGDGRYLQLVIPGFLLAAMVVLAVVGQRGRAGRVAASIFVVPLFVSHRLVRVRDGIPQVHGRRLFVLATSPNLVGPDAARPADGHRSAGWPCRTGMRP